MLFRSYVKKVDASALQTGDPITFMLDEDTVATHRIIEVIPDSEDAAVVRCNSGISHINGRSDKHIYLW